MIEHSKFRVLILIALVSLLSACFGLGSKESETGQNTDPDSEMMEGVVPQYYVVDVDRGAVAENFVRDRVLRIEPVRVTSHFRGQTLIFKVGKNEYQAQPPHQFFSQPSDMFTSQLKRWLEKTGLFSQVVTNEDVPADMVLETAVTALYGEQRNNYSPQAVLEMQFFLAPVDQNNAQSIFETGFRMEVNIPETTPGNVVIGWRVGLDELLLTLEDDLSDYFSKRDP